MMVVVEGEERKNEIKFMDDNKWHPNYGKRGGTFLWKKNGCMNLWGWRWIAINKQDRMMDMEGNILNGGGWIGWWRKKQKKNHSVKWSMIKNKENLCSSESINQSMLLLLLLFDSNRFEFHKDEEFFFRLW